MATARKDRREIERMPLSTLKPAPRNPKGHDDEGIGASFDEFGYVEPIVMDERTRRLVVGHGRWERLLASKAAGETPPEGITVDRGGEWLIPVMRGWRSRDATHAEAYLIASNQLTTKGGWEPAPLADVLADLTEAEMLDVTGFNRGDLDALLDSLNPATDEPEPDVDDKDDLAEPADPVTKLGDVWLVGDHRVMCGDCRNPDHVAQLLGDRLVNLAITSPPYADRRDYDETTEFRPIPPDQYVEWFEPVARIVGEHLAEDGSWVVNIKPGVTPDGDSTELYVLDLVMAHARAWGWNFATEFCWERSGVPKQPARRLKNQFEPVYQFACGRWKFRPEHVMHWSENVPLAGGPGSGDTSWHRDQGTTNGVSDSFGGSKRRRKGGTTELMADVQGTNTAPGEFIGPGMAYPGNRLPTLSGSHEATGHTAAFPAGLPSFFARLLTDEGDVVYDPFLGSGSTVLAAHQAGRVGRGMELSPAYVDISLRRIQRHTGIVPILEASGDPHDFLKDELAPAQ